MTETYARYSRQMNMVGIKGQEALNQARVLCIGAGGLGSIVSAYLVAAGVGEISIIDADSVELSNLTRQITYAETNCKHNKAITQANFLRKLNSETKVNMYDYNLDPANAERVISAHTLVVDCCDNFATRYLAGDECSAAAIPLISASVQGFKGHVMVLPGDVCYRCVFPVAADEAGLCTNTDVIGPAVGILASIQANEAIKFITNLRRVSQLITLDTFSYKTSIYSLSVDIKCINNHWDVSGGLLVEFIEYALAIKLYEQNQLIIIDLRAQVYPSANATDWVKTDLENIDKILSLITPGKAVAIICNYGLKSKIASLRLAAMGFNRVFYTYTKIC